MHKYYCIAGGDCYIHLRHETWSLRGWFLNKASKHLFEGEFFFKKIICLRSLNLSRRMTVNHLPVEHGAATTLWPMTYVSWGNEPWIVEWGMWGLEVTSVCMTHSSCQVYIYTPHALTHARTCSPRTERCARTRMRTPMPTTALCSLPVPTETCLCVCWGRTDIPVSLVPRIYRHLLLGKVSMSRVWTRGTQEDDRFIDVLTMLKVNTDWILEGSL